MNPSTSSSTFNLSCEKIIRRKRHVVSEKRHSQACSQRASSTVSLFLSHPTAILSLYIHHASASIFVFCVRSSRKKFGLLEKHKDYVERANAFHKKQDTLQVQFHGFLFVQLLILSTISLFFLLFNLIFLIAFIYFVSHRNLGKKLQIETRMSFTLRWLEQKPLMEFIDQSNDLLSFFFFFLWLVRSLLSCLVSCVVLC